MGLTLEKAVYEEMLEAAQDVVPLEGCGLLAGTGDRATKCYVLTNADASEEHFSMRPAEQFAAVKDMRRNGLTMLAIWHSHPASPARMSAEDMRLAFTPGVLHVIVSLAEAGRPQVRAFEARENVSQETPIVVEEWKGET